MTRLIDHPDGTATCRRGHRMVPYSHPRPGGGMVRSCRECQRTHIERYRLGLTFAAAEARRVSRRAGGYRVLPFADESPLCATCGDRGRLANGATCPDCAEEAKPG